MTQRLAALGSLFVLLVVATAVLSGGPAAADESAQAGETTTTLPVDNRQLGDIIPQPNVGREPQSAGDPGGWLQTSLFFLLVAAVFVIVAAVWRSSRRARQKREESGMDPVTLARKRGEGVRRPSADPPQHP